MFKKFQNLAADFVKQMRNPAEASRTIFAAMLILGLLGLTANFGGIIAAEKLQSRILLATTTAEKAETEKAKPISEIAEQCVTTRENGDAKELITQFEKSFAGILPGASQFLDKSVTVARKELLVRETMSRFVEMEYCIPRKNIDELVDNNYENVIDFLTSYEQVFLYEKNPSKYPLDKINRLQWTEHFGNTGEVEKDLREKEKFLRDTVEAAIDSAFALDQATRWKITSLMNETSNNLSADLNSALSSQQNSLNQIAIILSGIAGINNDIRTINAEENLFTISVLFGGTSTTTPYMKTINKALGIVLGNIPGKASIISSKQIGTGSIAEIESAAEQDLVALGISFGLLNLFETSELPTIMKKLGVEIAIYLGADYQVDPFTPGARDSFSTAASSIYKNFLKLGDDQLCSADKTCFGYK